MTNAEKFKEVFGRELEESRMLSNPSLFSQIIALKSFQIVGVDCADEWRNAEYVEPHKRGKWISHMKLYGCESHSYQCSVCGRSIKVDPLTEELTDYPYCHCGAKMKGDEE